MGLTYDYNIDLWSTAVTLYELYTGRIMFPGKSNNEMLRLIMETRGRFPNRVVRRGSLRQQHFDEQCNFLFHEIDKVTQKVGVAIGPDGCFGIDLTVFVDLFSCDSPPEDCSTIAVSTPVVRLPIAQSRVLCLLIENRGRRWRRIDRWEVA